jgi:hypothetical protein
MNESYRLRFITPLFCYGAYDDRPEVRPSSIRGQLHWWLRILGASATRERALFGSVHKNFGGTNLKAAASRVVVRVSGVEGKRQLLPTLPHKNGGMAAPKTAFAPGATCLVHFLCRDNALSADLQGWFLRTLEAWLCLGSLGLRTTRGAGSFVWMPCDASLTPSENAESFSARCNQLLSGSNTRFALLDQTFADPEAARKLVSDTIGGRQDSREQGKSLAELRHPLGRVFGGRKTSPLRFRIMELEECYRIAAVWDTRTEVTGNTQSHLHGVIRLLSERKPALGELLRNSALADL